MDGNGVVVFYHDLVPREIFRSTYKDGVEVDTIIFEYYSNGQKASEENHKDGKRDGPTTWWYSNGQKASEENHKDGKLVTSVAWKPNGEKCPVTNVVNGNGVSVWYNDNGTEAGRATYKDGEEVED